MAASDVLEVIQAIILGTSPVIPPLECIRRENLAFVVFAMLIFQYKIIKPLMSHLNKC